MHLCYESNNELKELRNQNDASYDFSLLNEEDA